MGGSYGHQYLRTDRQTFKYFGKIYIHQLVLLFTLIFFVQVVTSSLSSYTDKYEDLVKEGSGSSWLGTLSSMVGTMFIQVETTTMVVVINSR